MQKIDEQTTNEIESRSSRRNLLKDETDENATGTATVWTHTRHTSPYTEGMTVENQSVGF